MQSGRTVKLEILRHGPAHNQLLSPLTEYLALCGDHEACSLRLPFEQSGFLVHLSALRYGLDEQADPSRPVRLRQVAEEMGKIYASVPGLLADLSASSAQPGTLTHLRLIFSASELALLPFELASSPAGFPGESSPLSLQLQLPIAITREVRSASSKHVWPSEPKILMIIAQPKGGLEPDLIRAHKVALVSALQPWVESAEQETSRRRLSKLITVLENASYKSIEEACEREDFTHVHVLAHGDTYRVGRDERFGIALCSPTDLQGADVLDGYRLANALRVHHRRNSVGLSGPKVVTLAACDSADQGDLILPGASVAHALHEAGIPLVIASQFPLSKRASVVMTEVLYGRLLWGEDPRVVLHDLRQRLHGFDRNTHDWASIVAYASLPRDLETQLREIRAERAIAAMRVSLDRVQHSAQMPAAGQDPEAAGGFETSLQALDDAAEWVPEAAMSGDEETGRRHANRVEVTVMLAAMEKRKSELLWTRWRHVAQHGGGNAQELRRRSDTALRGSLAKYRRAFDLDRSHHWTGVCYFALKRNLEGIVDVDLWHTVRLAIRKEVNSLDHHIPSAEYAWCLSALIELLFHAWRTPELAPEQVELAQIAATHGLAPRVRKSRAERAEKAPGLDDALGLFVLAAEFAQICGPGSEPILSTRREIRRYIEWWKISEAHTRLAEELLHELSI